MIRVLDPKISLNNNKYGIYLSYLILKESGLIHSFVSSSPFDIIFTDNDDLFNIPLNIFKIDITKDFKLYKVVKDEIIQREPLFDNYILNFRELIKESFPLKWMFFKKWRNNAPYAVALSHDVDRTRYYSVTNYLRMMFKKSKDFKFKKGLYYLFHPKEDPYFQLKKLHEIEDENDVKSTFFFLTVKRDKHGRRYNLKNYHSILKNLNNSGWEVALHGSLKSKNSLNRLISEKNYIERLLDDKVKGLRYHHLIEEEKPLRFAELAGFEYDSSLSSSKEWVVRRGFTSPFYPWNEFVKRELQIYELPVNITDMALIGNNNYDMNFIDRIKKSGGLLHLLWHQRFFGPGFEDLSSIYWNIVYKAKEENAWISTISEIVDFIKAKNSIKILPDISGMRNYYDIENIVLSKATSMPEMKIKGKGKIKKISKENYLLHLYRGDVILL